MGGDMRVVLAISLLVVCFLAGVWDIVAVARGTPLDTVSRTLQTWSLDYPILPLIVGILLGHIFWPVSAVAPRPK